MCLARNCKCLQTPLSVSGTKSPWGENHQVTALGAPAVLEPVVLSANSPLVLHQKLSPTRNVEKQRWVGWGAGAEW